MDLKCRLYITLFFIILSEGLSGQSSTHASRINDKGRSQLLCKQQQQIAYADLKKGKAKYYNFGLLPPGKELSTKLKSNNIKVINENCIVIPELICYNNVILKKIKHKSK